MTLIALYFFFRFNFRGAQYGLPNIKRLVDQERRREREIGHAGRSLRKRRVGSRGPPDVDRRSRHGMGS